MTDAKVPRCAYIILHLFMNAFAYIWKGVNCHFWLLNILYTELDKKQGIEKFMISRIFCTWKRLKLCTICLQNPILTCRLNFSLWQKFSAALPTFPALHRYFSGFYHPVYFRWDSSFVKFRYSEKSNFFWKNLPMGLL